MEDTPYTLMASRVKLVLLLLLAACHVACAGAQDSSGGCVYSFQVWTPEQDVLQRMADLERRCSNVTSSVDYQLVLLKNQLIQEVMQSQNSSYRLQKDVLEQRLKYMQQAATLKELEGELADLKGNNRKLWEVIDGLQRGLPANGGQGEGEGHSQGQGLGQGLGQGQGQMYGNGLWVKLVTPGDLEEVRAAVIRSAEIVNELKNGVGDLKAEWMLIKRQVTDAKAEVLHAEFSQNDLKADTVKLKSLIEGLRTDSMAVKARIDAVTTAQTELGKVLGALQNGQDTSASSEEGDGPVYQDDLISFRNRLNHVDNELAKIQGQGEAIRREAISAAIGTRNLTTEDLNKLLRRLPFEEEEEGARGAETMIPKDCQDIYRQGHRTSGVYQIHPDGIPQLDNVYCEILNHTGWTVVQRRQDGTLSFNRRWMEYKHGFGNLYGEFWLGNEWLHRLTRQRAYRLRVDMWDWEGHRAFAEYDHFRVDSEEKKYTLHVRGYRGDAGDSLSYHDEVAFSTEDADNDLHMRNCAMENKGGWWFNSCYSSHLNGVYHTGRYSKPTQTYADGIVWYTWKESEFYSLRRTELKIKPMFA